jgi:hypothetical protein
MDEFIKMLNADYDLVDYKIKDTQIVFEIASNKSNCTSPYCGMASSKVHSAYQREIQDLSIHNKQTILLVNTRKSSVTIWIARLQRLQNAIHLLQKMGRKQND